MPLRRLFPTLRGMALAVLLGLVAIGAGVLAVQETLAQETGGGAAPAGAEIVAVQGLVVNGTGGGATPAEQPITLHTIDRAAGRVATAEATTDAAGRFRFEDVAIRDGRNYVLVMDYAGMRYSELLEPGAWAEPVELTVYETTKDISAVRVERQTMVIAGVNEQDREIAALEFLTLINAGDRTLLPELTNITNPGEISFLRFSLPAQASELDVQSTLPGGDIIAIGNGFAVTAPVMPGEHQVNYTYTFPYQGDRVIFNQRLLQGAGVYQVLAPVELAAIQISPLEPRPRVDVAGQVYLVWEGREIPPGRGVALELAQLPQPSLPVQMAQTLTDGNLWESAIPVMLALALAALLIYAWFRGHRPAPATAGMTATLDSSVDHSGADYAGGGVADPAPAGRQALVQAIARLDDSFEQGQLSEGEYQSRRAGLLEQLRPAANPLNPPNPAYPVNPAGAEPGRDS